jgi:DNA repair exonuclease SbcCD nuclease subunit
MRLAQINDCHLSDKAPLNRTESYLDDTVQELLNAMHIAAAEKCEAILLPGDLFHIPAASRVSHSLVATWLTILDQCPIPEVFITPGNHDLSAGRLDSLPTQPLGILKYHPKVKILHSGLVALTHDISIAGIEWNYTMDRDFFIQRIPLQLDVLITHAPIAPKPNPFYDTIQQEDLSGIAKFVAYGHIHKQAHPVKINGQTTFSNPGALSRGTIGEDDLGRKPSVAIIDTDRDTVDYITIPHKPVEEIFRLLASTIRETNDTIVDEFVRTLAEAEVDAVSIEDILGHVKAKLDSDPRAMAIAEDIIRGAT